MSAKKKVKQELDVKVKQKVLKTTNMLKTSATISDGRMSIRLHFWGPKSMAKKGAEVEFARAINKKFALRPKKGESLESANKRRQRRLQKEFLACIVTKKPREKKKEVEELITEVEAQMESTPPVGTEEP